MQEKKNIQGQSQSYGSPRPPTHTHTHAKRDENRDGQRERLRTMNNPQMGEEDHNQAGRRRQTNRTSSIPQLVQCRTWEILRNNNKTSKSTSTCADETQQSKKNTTQEAAPGEAAAQEDTAPKDAIRPGTEGKQHTAQRSTTGHNPR